MARGRDLKRKHELNVDIESSTRDESDPQEVCIDNRSTIRNLLKSIGLAKYCHRFEEADISYDDFLKLRDDQFEKLKIPVASKRKIKSEIKRINASWKSNSATVDLPLPEEMIVNVMSYLSLEDLLNFATVANKSLKECCYRLLTKKSLDIPQLLWKMSILGNLKVVKQIFVFIKQEKLSVDDMGVESSDSNLADCKFSDNGRTLFMEAALKGRVHVCEYLVKKQNTNVNARDHDESTALILAAYHNNLRAVKLLLNYDVNIKAKNKDGSHAAYIAALHGNIQILKALVEKDKDVIDIKAGRGTTPLIGATMRSQFEVCKYLCEEMKADVNIQNDRGYTALFWAVFCNKIRIVDLLINNDEKLLNKTYLQQLLTIARKNKNSDIVKKLEEHFKVNKRRK